MKATVPWLGALLLAGAAASLAHAASYVGSCCPYPCLPDPRWPNIPRAPDAYGPGFYALNGCGCPYGPNYCLRPPWPPFNGLLPGPKCPPPAPAPGVTPGWAAPAVPGVAPVEYPGQPPPPPIFPTHPFARSPRDFFMVD